jgi:hypothetical protein
VLLAIGVLFQLDVVRLRAQQAQPNAGGIPAHFLSTASTNATVVKNSIGNVYNIIAINATATMVFLKLYDSATIPNCNSTPVVQTYPVPFGTSSSGAGLAASYPVGMQFYKGISFCLTGGIADNDNSAAQTGVAIDFVYK